MINTHYDSLQVSRTAPLEVIRAAYKILAQKYHPDRNQGDAEANRLMQVINVAYEVLSDPIKRAEYDRWIELQENLKNKPYSESYHFREETNTKRENKELPDGIQGWSWGAFLLNGIWAIANKTWVGLLVLIPFVGFFVAILLGVKGREWAWKNKKWESVEQFESVQKKWSVWGVTIYISLFVLGILAAILIPAYENKAIRNQTVTVLEGLRLGLRPVDVTLYAGHPENFEEKPKESEEGDYYTLSWSFVRHSSSYPYSENSRYYVYFWGESMESLKINRICSDRLEALNIKGFRYLEYTNEHEIIDKLGKPTYISIHKSGVSKILSYIPMNVSFEFKQGSMVGVCISDSGVSYLEEYQNGQF